MWTPPPQLTAQVQLLTVRVRELHRPVAAEGGADGSAAVAVDVVAPREPVEHRRPLPLRIRACEHRRLADARHVEEEDGEAARAQERAHARIRLLLPRVDAAPEHDDRRPLDSEGPQQIERDLAPLAVPAVERDGDALDGWVVQARRGEEERAGAVVQPLLCGVIRDGVAADEGEPVRLQERLSFRGGIVAPLRGRLRTAPPQHPRPQPTTRDPSRRATRIVARAVSSSSPSSG